MRTFEVSELVQVLNKFGFELDRYDAARGIYKSPSFPDFDLYVYTRLAPVTLTESSSALRECLMGVSVYRNGNKAPVYASSPGDYDEGIDLVSLGNFLYSYERNKRNNVD